MGSLCLAGKLAMVLGMVFWSRKYVNWTNINILYINIYTHWIIYIYINTVFILISISFIHHIILLEDVFPCYIRPFWIISLVAQPEQIETWRKKNRPNGWFRVITPRKTKAHPLRFNGWSRCFISYEMTSLFSGHSLKWRPFLADIRSF